MYLYIYVYKEKKKTTCGLDFSRNRFSPLVGDVTGEEEEGKKAATKRANGQGEQEANE